MKKTLILALALIMIFSVSINAFAATVPGSVYSDQNATGVNMPVAQIQQELEKAGVVDVKPTDWFAGSVTVIVQAGLIAPAADGSFMPEAELKADEGVAVFAKVLGIASKTDTPAQALAKAADAGLVSPTMQPSQDLDRMSAAQLLGTALGVTPATVASAADFPFVGFDSYTPAERGLLKALYDLGIFRGFPEENGKPSFRPDTVLTRAQIALLVDRLLG